MINAPLCQRVVTLSEVDDKGINLVGMNLIGEFSTPFMKGIFYNTVRQRLKYYIEEHRREAGADIAVIESKTMIPRIIRTQLSYDYRFYKY